MFAGNWTEQATNFLVFIVLARVLGAEAFGLAAMALVVVVLGEFLVRDTLTETIIQLEEVEDGHLDAVFWLLAGLSVGLVGLIVLCADPIARLYSEPRVAGYLVWAAPAVLWLGLSGVPVACLRRQLEFRVLAIRATVGVLAGGAVGIAMALADLGPWSLVGQHVTLVFVNGAVAWGAHPWRPGFRARRRHLRDVLYFSLKMVGLRATELVSLNAPTVVIGSYLGPVALGHFTLAWRLVEILSLVLTTPIRFVAQPGFAHLHRSGRGAGQLLHEVMDTCSVVTFVSFLGLAAVAAPTVRSVFGETWMPAVPVLQILCGLGIYLSLERLQQAYSIAVGRAGRLTVLAVIEGTLAIIAMVLVADRGLVAVTIAFPTVLLVLWPLRIRFVTSLAELGMANYLRVFALPLTLAVLTAGVVVGWQALIEAHVSTLTALVSAVLVGVAIYGGCLWLMMRERLRTILSSLQVLRRRVPDAEA